MLSIFIYIVIYFLQSKHAHVTLSGNNLHYINVYFYDVYASGDVSEINISSYNNINMLSEYFLIYKDNELIYTLYDNIIIQSNGGLGLCIKNYNSVDNMQYSLFAHGLRETMHFHYSNELFMPNKIFINTNDKIFISSIKPPEKLENNSSWILEFSGKVIIKQLENVYIDTLVDGIKIIAKNPKGIYSFQCESISFTYDIFPSNDKWELINIYKMGLNVKGDLTFSRKKNFINYIIGNQDISFISNKNIDTERLSANLSRSDDDYSIYVNGHVKEAVISKTNLFYNLFDFLESINIVQIIITTIISCILEYFLNKNILIIGKRYNTYKRKILSFIKHP